MLRMHTRARGRTAPLELLERMRRFVPLVPFLLVLPGCTGFGTFLAHSVSFPGTNPNRPAADSENMRRAYGAPAPVSALQPETGNVWPGPQRPDPTLTDLEQQQNRDTSGAQQNGQPPRTRGSSTPPQPVPPRSSGGPGVPPLPEPPPGTAPAPRPGGVVVTPRGNLNDAGGTNSYRQLTAPGTPGAIVVPNGNGTSTVISPDGGVQVIPTPR